MPLVDLTSTPLPNDDENADAIDIAGPISAILAVLNGHIDRDNIEPGSLPWSVMDTFTGEIPADAMEDDGNSKKYRDEAGIGFISSGVVVSNVSGLNGAVSAGVIYAPDGQRSAVSAVASRAYTASKDTYVDVAPNGSISYSEVANGAAPPTLTAGYMRVALVVTDSTEITAVHDLAARRDGEGWRPIARIRLGATRSSLVLGQLPAKRHLKIFMHLVATGGTVGPALRFNGDTGNNYSRRSSLNGDSDGTQTSRNASSSGGTSSSQVDASVEVSNFANRQKFIQGTQVAGDSKASNAPDRLFWTGKWANTSDQITRIDIINSGTGNFAAGTEVIVYGQD